MKKKKCLFLVFKKGAILAAILTLMLFLCLFSDETIPAAKETLSLCAQNIIPSLFPFFVLCGILIKSGFAKHIGKILSPLMRPLFKVSGVGGFAFIIGIVSGYPMGAKAVCDLYKSGSLSQREAQKLLPFCNNSGPLFVIGAIGTGMLKNSNLGIFLYIIHFASAVLVGLLTGFFSKSEKHDRLPFRQHLPIHSFGTIFSQSVKDAVNSILLVCGFVVFFAAISSPFVKLLPRGSVLEVLVKGLLEVTSGAHSATLLKDTKLCICLISAFVGFGGFSVLLQVMGIVKEAGLLMKTYFWGKLLQGTISFVLCNIFLKKTEVISVFAPQNAINFETGNFGATVTSVFIICVFYFSVLAFRKNFKRIEQKSNL